MEAASPYSGPRINHRSAARPRPGAARRTAGRPGLLGVEDEPRLTMIMLRFDLSGIQLH